jgi:hypothetical protein
VTANRIPEADLPAQDISPARLHGEACFDCGAAEAPLHPGGTIELDDGSDISRVYDIVVCTGCLKVDR